MYLVRDPDQTDFTDGTRLVVMRTTLHKNIQSAVCIGDDWLYATSSGFHETLTFEDGKKEYANYQSSAIFAVDGLSFMEEAPENFIPLFKCIGGVNSDVVTSLLKERLTVLKDYEKLILFPPLHWNSILFLGAPTEDEAIIYG